MIDETPNNLSEDADFRAKNRSRTFPSRNYGTNEPVVAVGVQYSVCGHMHAVALYRSYIQINICVCFYPIYTRIYIYICRQLSKYLINNCVMRK
jgi:hypothetical protein